jgi:endoglucanase
MSGMQRNDHETDLPEPGAPWPGHRAGKEPMRAHRIASVSVAPLACVVVVACGPIGTQGTTTDGAGDDASASGNGDGSSSGAGGADGASPLTEAGGDGPSAGDAGGGASTDQAAPGGYHVVGNTIYDGKGAPHRFHGLDRPSLEWSATGDHLSQTDYALMGSWKANVVRIALNQDFWLQASPSYAPTYAQTVDQQIQWAEAAGLDVVLDLHWSDKGDFSTKPAQQRMADAHSLTFWQEVAARYKGDGRVLFELYNEPHDVPWSVWLNGGASGDGFTVTGMQQLYDAVRGAGAENLVVCGGLQFAYDLSAVAQAPVQGHNVVYATHPYNQPNKQPANWDAGFGNLTALYPVMATEFGDTGSCVADYYSALIAYADAHGMSWSGWAWYPSGCSFPSLVSDWNGTPTAAGQVEKAALLAY